MKIECVRSARLKPSRYGERTSCTRNANLDWRRFRSCLRLDMPQRRPPRLDRSLYLGFTRVFLTMCTDRRRKVFIDPDDAISAQVQLLSTASAYAIEVVAYSFMPDHLHAFLAGTTENSDPLKCCDVFRSRTGFHHRARHRPRLWQQGYYDRLLRDKESTFDVVSYIVMNPVELDSRGQRVSTRTQDPAVIRWKRSPSLFTGGRTRSIDSRALG